MPVQKGKRRKRPRNRGITVEASRPDTAPQPNVQSRGHRATARPVARKRWTPPLWVNVIVGLGMLALGALFTFVLPQKGMTTTVKLALFAGYCVIAAFYLSKAYRQYRARQSES